MKKDPWYVARTNDYSKPIVMRAESPVFVAMKINVKRKGRFEIERIEGPFKKKPVPMVDK